MQFEELPHRLFRLQDGKGAGVLSGFGEFQHQIVAADQYVGLTDERQFQKHLVIWVAATGQSGRSLRQRLRDQRHALSVGAQHALLADVIQPELRVGDHPFQLGQCLVIRQTSDPAGGNGRQQRRQWRRRKMQQIHHHVGIQNKARQLAGCHG